MRREWLENAALLMVTSDSKNEQQRTDVKRERFSLCLVFITKLSGLRLSHDVRLEDFVAWSYDATIVLQVTYN